MEILKAIARCKSLPQLERLENWVDRFDGDPRQEVVEAAWLNRRRQLKRR